MLHDGFSDSIHSRRGSLNCNAYLYTGEIPSFEEQNQSVAWNAYLQTSVPISISVVGSF